MKNIFLSALLFSFSAGALAQDARITAPQPSDLTPPAAPAATEPAPGFTLKDMAGNTVSLSDFKGKVVYIDFWASWCGPCRKENPNVVAQYKKYKDKGFDILGVSLDRDHGAWKRAIEQDGLPWHHISDLKGWQSQHAQLYSINSIPQTVLVDKEGKIIARNLRGESLEAKLKELFGI